MEKPKLYYLEMPSEDGNVRNPYAYYTKIKRRACMLVHSVLQNNICYALGQYFTYQEHGMNTRNNKYSVSVCLPQFRTGYARKGFFYMRVKTSNELPLTTRMVNNLLPFREIINNKYNCNVQLYLYMFF